MNWGKVIALGLIAGGLVGCGKQVEGPTKTAASKSTQAVKPVKHQAKQKVVWSAIKGERLAALMDEFADSRNQSYVKVNTDSNTTWQGLDLSGYLRDKRQVSFAGQEKAVKWLGTRAAKAQATANVVAVYADDTAGILYLFEVTPDDQTLVWVSQAAPGDGELAVKQTAATDLTDGFKQIVAGQRAHLPKPATQAASAASSQTQAKTSRQSKDGHAPVFDASFQHTWYSFDGTGNRSDITFHANGFDNLNLPSTEVYLASERTAEDEQALNNPAEVQPDEDKMHWGAATKFTAEGRNYVNVRGWYQTAGDGSYYRVVNRTVDGQSQPVLEIASGAGIWLDANYYLTEATAAANKDVVYPDQNKPSQD